MTPAIFGIAGTQLTADERAFFRESDPAGYILFARNISDRAQLRALTDDLRGIHGRERLLISIDQEGGRVARMKPPEWDAYPAADAFAALYRLAPSSAMAAARANAELIGRDCAEVGITLDFLPLLDVRQPEGHDVIGDRALGSEPMQVAALGRAVLQGLGAAGVLGCVKHMPGHGRAGADSHHELPRVDAGEDALESDIEPFRTLSGAAIGMTSHVCYSAWDAEHPATLSPRVIGDVIRGRIGFDGLLLTDDIDMRALEGDVPDLARAALAAGCDIVLNCWARMEHMEAIAERCGSLDTDGMRRLDAALDGIGNCADDPPPRGELLAQRDALLQLVGAPA